MSRMNLYPVSDVVWVHGQILTACSREATRMFPLETGGVFMGYWADAHSVVITQMFGPGPSAVHGRDYFEPDANWQWRQIASHYELSGRRETYVGDWHSHPHAHNGDLSRTDRRAIRMIAAAPSSRCPAPVMCILWGQPDSWRTATWRARLHQTMLLNRLRLTQGHLRVPTGDHI